MQHCFLIQYNHSTSTAFLLGTDQGSMFVAAAHSLRGAVVGDFVLIKRGDDWSQIEIAEIHFDEDGYDVCTFTSCNFYISKNFSTEIGGEVSVGQGLSFLGFPHGLEGTYPGQGYPTPLVRTAFFSGVIHQGDHQLVVLDGFNNPGFSGAPVFCPDAKGDPLFFGIISSYRYERISHSRIYRRDANDNEIEVPDIYTKPNSGLITCIGQKQIQPTIKKIESYNPVRAK